MQSLGGTIGFLALYEVNRPNRGRNWMGAHAVGRAELYHEFSGDAFDDVGS